MSVVSERHVASVKRVVYYDILNVVAAFSVVLMHTNEAYWNFRPTKTWVMNLIIEKSLKFAVPIFFMLTGATLMDYREKYSTGKYAQKRIRRAVIPFLFWSIIGLLFSRFLTHSTPSSSIAHYINMIITTSIPEVNVYWFFIPLFLAYLAIPVFSCIPSSKRNDIFSFLIIWYLVFTAAKAFLPLIGVQVNSILDNPFTANDLVYVLLGYLLSNNNIDKRITRALIVLGFLAVLSTVLGSLTASFASNKLVNATIFESAYFLWPIAVFLICKALFSNNSLGSRVSSLFAQISAYTFGIYLVHRYLLIIVVRLFHVKVILWWWPCLGALIVFFASALLVFLLKHIPILKELV
ncbi:acyltransferase [Bifidobacterium sp. SO1]|uniref:acyltransferase n=1 Tax=Bifidobacterium sp. SO1 TaxID=2809029 RepID=UPI001BDCBAB0|nr:acyltransferase [Bifidobacterium sp. SO1]MBT1162622.1 acyltransferase [Bifidobacterium sp. SO1]